MNDGQAFVDFARFLSSFGREGALPPNPYCDERLPNADSQFLGVERDFAAMSEEVLEDVETSCENMALMVRKGYKLGWWAVL